MISTLWTTEDPAGLATCLELPEEEAERLFFGGDVVDLTEGKRLCLECPVLEKCRAEGDRLEPVKKGYIGGVLGGEFPAERIARRKAAKS